MRKSTLDLGLKVALIRTESRDASLTRSISDQPKSEIAVAVAPFTEALHRLQRIALQIVDGDGEHLVQLAEELRHLIRGQL